MKRGVNGNSTGSGPVNPSSSLGASALGLRILKQLRDGTVSFGEIARIEQCSKSTVGYYARKLGMSRIHLTYRKNTDWNKIQILYNEVASVNEVVKRTGLSRSTLYDAVKRGLISFNNNRRSADDILHDNFRGSSSPAKRLLLREGILHSVCSKCLIGPIWMGDILTIQLEHKNGNKYDWRLENLDMLCPNCHSQTSTYARRKYL